MNIDTDTQWAYWDGLRGFYKKNEGYLQGQVGNLSHSTVLNNFFLRNSSFALSCTDWQPRRCRQAQQEVLRPPGLDQGGRGIYDQASPRKLQVPQREQCLRRRLAKVFLNVFSAEFPLISQDKLGIWSWSVKPNDQNIRSLNLILFCVSEQEI